MATDGECALDSDPGQPGKNVSIGVLGHVEPVHGAAQVQVAVWVEGVHEAVCMAFQVVFNLEFQSEWCVVGLVRIQAYPAKTPVPFQRGAVGDHPKFACDA